MGDTGDASNGSAGSSSSTSSRGTRTRETMQITIDSQSFVNLGQLMGGSSNGHGISGSSSAAATLSGLSPGGTASANNNLGASSFLSESSDSSLRDFDHIFHPAESNSSAWSGHGVCSDKEDAVHEDDEDDSDSILPALPPRSPTPGSPTSSELNSNRCPFKAAEAGWADDIINAASAGGGSGNFGPCVLDASADGKCAGVALVGGGGELGDKHACVDKEVVTSHTENNTEHRHVQSSMQGTPSRPSSTSSSPSSSYASRTVGDEDATAGDTAALSSSTSLLRESWLHVDQYGIDQGDNNSTMEVDTETKVQQEEHGEEEVGGAGGCACGERARRIGAVLGECGSCFACGVTKAAALVRPRVQQLVERAKVPVQAGAGACQRGQQALAEAADNVPQAPGACLLTSERETETEKDVVAFESWVCCCCSCYCSRCHCSRVTWCYRQQLPSVFVVVFLPYYSSTLSCAILFCGSLVYLVFCSDFFQTHFFGCHVRLSRLLQLAFSLPCFYFNVYECTELDVCPSLDFAL